MGKVFPFARKKSDYSNAEQRRAEALIEEAADILNEAGCSNASVPWILEDCVELLRTKKRNSLEEKIDQPEEGGCRSRVSTGQTKSRQKDPRHLLNPNSNLSSIVRR